MELMHSVLIIAQDYSVVVVNQDWLYPLAVLSAFPVQRLGIDIVVILISFFVSGILLVVSILVLNLTVAVGTLNGLIFYANIIGANTSIFFPTANLRFISNFLSWLNLEMGFDACFYDGLDTYWKTWLQLAFPIYIIVLVIIMIIVSEYSMKFSELLARKNPVQN